MPQFVVIQGEPSEHEAEVDRIAKALITIDTVHGRVHEGVVFTASSSIFNILAGGVIDMLTRVPVDVTAHVKLGGYVGANSSVELYEGTSTSNPGTAVTTFNRNRTSTTTAEMLVFHTPTITDLGTKLWTEFIPGGATGNTGAGSDVSQTEWILDEGDYLTRLTNISPTTAPASLQLFWYEPVPTPPEEIPIVE